MRLFIIRHGESQDDLEDCYGGIADFPLTPKGREQAIEVAGKLRSLGIEAIYTSPLARASETASLIGSALSLSEPIVIDDLQERNTYGVLSGVNKARAEQLFGRILATLTEKPGYSKQTIPGGEEYELFVLRVQRAIDNLYGQASRNGIEVAAAVTHGKFTQALFERVFRLGADVLPQLGAVNVVDYEPAHAQIVTKIALPA